MQAPPYTPMRQVVLGYMLQVATYNVDLTEAETTQYSI